MNRSATIGWRIFFAHLTDLGIWFYIIFFVVGLIPSHNLFIRIILPYIAALLLSFTFSALWFSRFGFTPSEWLWGCKLQIRDSGGSRFFSYFVRRIYSNGPEYADDKNSVWKNGIGADKFQFSDTVDDLLGRLQDGCGPSPEIELVFREMIVSGSPDHASFLHLSSVICFGHNIPCQTDK
jgi:hypothetical protein